MSISSRELARRKIEELVRKFERSKRSDFTEQDTVTHFIMPLLEALGWNVSDVYEVKQGGYPVNIRRAIPTEYRPLDRPDCVVSLSGNPYLVFEFKRLADGGAIDRDERRINKLWRMAENELNTKYAVLTNFCETVVYLRANEESKWKQLIRFNNPKEYLSKFKELWKYLSKEAAEQQTIS